MPAGRRGLRPFCYSRPLCAHSMCAALTLTLPLKTWHFDAVIGADGNTHDGPVARVFPRRAYGGWVVDKLEPRCTAEPCQP